MEDRKDGADLYRKADRKRLASTAAPLLLLPTQTQNENRPHLESGAGATEN